MKNKILAALLAGLMLLSVGCGSATTPGDTTDGTSDTAETTPAETEPPIVYPTTDDMPEDPIGTGIGVKPGRVTWAFNPEAFHWDGNGYWWMEKNFDVESVKTMVVDMLCQLAGKDDINEALTALFTDFNERVNGKAEGYKAGQKIAIKVNMNATGNGAASNNSTKGYFPSPVMTRALLEVLVAHGVAPSDITLYDGSRMIPTYLQEMCSAGDLKGVNFAYYDDTANGRNDVVADTTKPIKWSIDFTAEETYEQYNGYPTYNTAYYPTIVTEATYMINLFNLRGHTLASFTASAKNHFGTVMPGYHKDDGSITFPAHYRSGPPTYSGLHRWVAGNDYLNTPKEIWWCPKRPMNTYTPLVDLLSNADAGGKTFLYICDALGATVHQGSSMSINEKWYSAPFGDGTKAGRGWTNSLFASQDPVAIDSVMLDFLLAEQDAAEAVGDNKWNASLPEGNTGENYLIEAAQADNPPSGVKYQDGYGNPVGSLGVHQHWNNAEEKYYSRNLGADEGIELVLIEY